MNQENKEEMKEKDNKSEFKSVIDKEEINQLKVNLVQIKTFLEQKIEKEINNFIQTKEDFHHLLHLERISKMNKKENNGEL